MYGEERYKCGHSRNNPPTSRVLSQLSHGLYTSRKELKRAFSTRREMFGSERKDHESDRFSPLVVSHDRLDSLASRVGFRLGNWTANQDYVPVCASLLIMPQLSSPLTS